MSSCPYTDGAGCKILPAESLAGARRDSKLRGRGGMQETSQSVWGQEIYVQDSFSWSLQKIPITHPLANGQKRKKQYSSILGFRIKARKYFFPFKEVWPITLYWNSLSFASILNLASGKHVEQLTAKLTQWSEYRNTGYAEHSTSTNSQITKLSAVRLAACFGLIREIYWYSCATRLSCF